MVYIIQDSWRQGWEIGKNNWVAKVQEAKISDNGIQDSWDRGRRQARTVGLRKYMKLKYKTMVFKIVGTGEGDRQEQLG